MALGSKQQDMYCRYPDWSLTVVLFPSCYRCVPPFATATMLPGSVDVPTTTAPLSPVKTDVTTCYVKRNCEPRSSGHEEAYGRNVVKPSSAR